MKPEQALNLISQVLAQFRGTRQEHAQLQQAEMVLRGLLPKEKPEKKEEKK